MSEQATPARSVNTSAEQAVAKLEQELSRRKRGRYLRLLVGSLLIAGLAGGGYWYKRSLDPAPEPRFATRSLMVRDISQRVESTGRLKPLTQVQVGAQVSGRVVAVHADFNSHVKQGDLLAEIDSRLAGAQVGQVAGQFEAAKASKLRAQYQRSVALKELDRVKKLHTEGVASQAELDRAKANFDVAEADIVAATATISGLAAQLSSARATLAYTKIYSPIDGVVILRAVEPGQTLAASFAPPVLFEIAQDLSKMQVMADVDEADVGKLHEGLPAEVEVDAFIGEVFKGKVTQIRYSPNEVQGVVTYSAVIDVANPESKLRPGMTATVSITTRERRQVLAIANSALRFKPEAEAGGAAAPQPVGHHQGRVFEISGGTLGQEQVAARVIDLGITDGVWTEVLSKGLNAGMEFVTEQRDRQKERRPTLGIF